MIESGALSTSNDSPVVSVVVVSHDSREWLSRCLGSISENVTPVEIIVVDNGSTDGSADLVAQEFADVQLIRSEENLGFGKGVNTGAAIARGRYLLLLNPDGWLESGAIDALVSFAEAHPEFVICGGRTVSPAGDYDPRSCWRAPSLWSLFCSATLLSTIRIGAGVFNPEAMTTFKRDRERVVDIVTGCLLLIATEDWKSLGGFDERFFLYGEDADLCLRAATDGRRCAITPTAVMAHAAGASSTRPEKLELLTCGRITLVQERWTFGRARVGRALILGGVALRARLARLGVGQRAWIEVWERRSEWQDGYPMTQDQSSGEATGRSRGQRVGRFVQSVLDPRSYVHAFRLLHYFHYTHVAERPKLTSGEGSTIAPNVSLLNAERITIGARSRVNARCYVWGGDKDGRVTIGSDCAIGPGCFITASNYGIDAGLTFLHDNKVDGDVIIGDGVWLGTSVIVLPGVTIGDGCVVAAGSVVTKDLPPNSIAGGVPARVIRERQ